MKIKQINPIIIELPLASPITTSFGTMTSRKHMIIEISTHCGLLGYGEVWTNFPLYNAEDKLSLYNNYIIPLLTNATFDNPNDIYSLLEENLLHSGAGRQWGALGHLTQAISGVDIAIWDIYSKGLNLPLYQAINKQATAIKIPAYASGLGPSNVLELTQKALSNGYNMFKLKVGFSIEKDLDNLKDMRSLIGNKLLFIDANQGYPTSEVALSHLDQFTKYNFSFIEEPIPSNDLFGLKSIRDANYVVAGGENIYSILDFSNLHKLGCLDIYQPDVGKCGGITSTISIVNYLISNNLQFAPHMFSTIIGQTASLHILTAYNGLFMEVDGNYNPALSKLASSTCFDFSDGSFIHNGSVSGLGIQLDKNYIRKFRLN